MTNTKRTSGTVTEACPNGGYTKYSRPPFADEAVSSAPVTPSVPLELAVPTPKLPLEEVYHVSRNQTVDV